MLNGFVEKFRLSGLDNGELFTIIIPMSKPGPKKRIEDRLTISLISGQKRQLMRCAKKDGESLAQIVRSALNDYLERNLKPCGKGVRS